MTTKSQGNRPSRSSFTYPQFVEFFNPPPPPTMENSQKNAGVMQDKVKKQVQPRHRKSGISCSSLHKMIRKIAYRHVYLKVNNNTPLWSAPSKGSPSKDTAKLIDKSIKETIQNQWADPDISSEVFVNLLIKKFSRCTDLESTWVEWKDRKIDDFLL